MSIHSPKAKFRIQVNFAEPVKGIGSVVSFSSDSIDQLKALAMEQVRQAKVSATVVITENKATYPSFDWQQVELYTIN